MMTDTTGVLRRVRGGGRGFVMGIGGRVFLTLAMVLLCVGDCRAFNCGVTTTPVKFAGYDVFSSSATTSTGTITVSCSNPVQQPLPVAIAISSGSSGSFNPRQMRATTGSDRLNYYLFADPSRTIIWGDGTGGSSIQTNLVTRQASWIAYVYGVIPPRQNLGA